MGKLLLCLSFGAGEYLGSACPRLCWVWPVAAVAALLVALFGYGLGARGWRQACLFLCGLALCLRASVADETRYLARPWLRDLPRRARAFRSPGGSFVQAVRRDVRRRTSVGLAHDPRAVELGRAILLGERANLSAETRRIFRDSGTMHVFAVSGVHVMAVAAVIVVLLALVSVPRRFAGLAAVPLLWGYVHLVGWPPSAMRAALMASIYLVAPVFWRRPDALSAWCIAFLVLHVWRPALISDTGSALSFAVMLSIVLTGRLAGPRPTWRTALVMTCVSWAAGVPIAAHVFGRVTPGALLANPVLVPAASAAVALGVAGTLASYVSESLAAYLNNLAALVVHAMVGVSAVVSRLPWACLEVRAWPLWQCAAWYLALALLGALAVLRRRGRAL